jgi:hypothetical protein
MDICMYVCMYVWGAVSPQLMLGCGWYAPLIGTLCKYKVWVMRSLRRCSRCGGDIPVGCGGSGRLVIEVGWRRCDGRERCGWGRLTALLLEDCWECTCSSLRLACWGVLFSEDRWGQRVDLAGSRWSLRRPASVGVAAYRTCRASCTGGMCVLTGREASSWLWRLSCLFLRPLCMSLRLCVCFSVFIYVWTRNCTPSNLLPPYLQPQLPPTFSDQAYTLRATCPFSCTLHPLINNLRGGVMWEPPMRTSHICMYVCMYDVCMYVCM